jgi:4-hydroxy-tetrahydrodipicolinate synthase
MMTRDDAKRRWRGVVIPLVTPFREDGSIDVTALRHNVEWLLERGARTGNTIFLAAGSGGDFTVMNVDERKRVISVVADTVGDRAPVIAGAQSTDIRDCIAIARHCSDLGIDAIQISGPYYYDGRPDDFVAWMGEVAGASEVGLALYNHYYSGAKYDVPIELIERLLELPGAIGVKWASASAERHWEGMRRFLPRVAVVDNSLLIVESHLRGCRAFVSHIPNFLPEFAWHVIELCEAGDYLAAQAAYDAFMLAYSAIVGQIRTRTAGEGVFVRPFMAAVGLGGGHSRLPSRDAAVTPELHRDIRALLERSGARHAPKA